MSEENRKATDILLSIESKLEALLNYHKSQDLNLKTLSNKINNLSEVKQPLIQKNESNNNVFAVTAEAVDVAPFVTANKSLPQPLSMEDSIIGIRRSSRDQLDDKTEFKDYDRHVIHTKNELPILSKEKSVEVKHVQITQRVVNKNQQSVFLAEVEIKDLDDNLVSKTRTNSVGKWSATIPSGKYRVSVNKKESSSKQKIEALQDIYIDGSKSIDTLPDLIIK